MHRTVEDYRDICLKMEHRARTDPAVIAALEEQRGWEERIRQSERERWSRPVSKRGKAVRPFIEDRIVEALTGADPLSGSAVARLVQVNKRKVFKALSGLLAAGRVDRQSGPNRSYLWSLSRSVPVSGSGPVVPTHPTGGVEPAYGNRSSTTAHDTPDLTDAEADRLLQLIEEARPKLMPVPDSNGLPIAPPQTVSLFQNALLFDAEMEQGLYSQATRRVRRMIQTLEGVA